MPIDLLDNKRRPRNRIAGNGLVTPKKRAQAHHRNAANGSDEGITVLIGNTKQLANQPIPLPVPSRLNGFGECCKEITVHGQGAIILIHSKPDDTVLLASVTASGRPR